MNNLSFQLLSLLHFSWIFLNLRVKEFKKYFSLYLYYINITRYGSTKILSPAIYFSVSFQQSYLFYNRSDSMLPTVWNWFWSRDLYNEMLNGQTIESWKHSFAMNRHHQVSKRWISWSYWIDFTRKEIFFENLVT